MEGLDKGVANRIRQSIVRFANTGAGDVRRLQGVDPTEHRLRVGDYRVRFYLDHAIIRILHSQPQRCIPMNSRSTAERD